jgi:putative lumazine-binding protein
MATSRRPSALETRAIRETVRDYILSWYTWDRERLKGSLHPSLAKRIVSTNSKTGRSELKEYPVGKMLRLVVSGAPRSRAARKKGAKAWNGYIKILDSCKDMAIVKTDAVWGIDYLHLAKWNGEWKIINVLWARHEKREH